jgi:MFS transporter, UMF1 family
MSSNTQGKTSPCDWQDISGMAIVAPGLRIAGMQQQIYPPRSAVISWIFFDWAAQPYFTLITTFVFAPYFATHVASDPASGQSLWGFATAAAGFAIALMSPVLGAIADASGRRKPWIAAFGALLVIGSCLMWIGRPGDVSVIPLLLLAYAIATVGAEFATVFNNAMMPTLVPPDRIGRLSGTGWATGYIGGILSLILVLGFLAASPETGRTLFGFTPLFGLDPVSHQGDRISGPLTGIWFIIFVLPMFLLTPDYPARLPVREALREGLTELRETLRELPQRKSMSAFLLANMIYTDGLVSLFAFGGIYAAGTFGWNTIQIGTFGIMLIHMAPKDRIAQYFGLFALTGKVTSFVGPLLIGVVTAVTESQKAGMAVLVLFFVAGLALLGRVRD